MVRQSAAWFMDVARIEIDPLTTLSRSVFREIRLISDDGHIMSITVHSYKGSIEVEVKDD